MSRTKDEVLSYLNDNTTRQYSDKFVSPAIDVRALRRDLIRNFVHSRNKEDVDSFLKGMISLI